MTPRSRPEALASRSGRPHTTGSTCPTCLGFGHLENLGSCPDCQPDTVAEQVAEQASEQAALRSPLTVIGQACRDLCYPYELAAQITVQITADLPYAADAEVTPQALLLDLRRLRQSRGDDPDVCRVIDTAADAVTESCPSSACLGCRVRPGHAHAVCCPWSLYPNAVVTEFDTEHDPWPAGTRRSATRTVRAFTGYAQAVATACADLGVTACPEDGQIQHEPAWVSIAVASQRSEVAWDDAAAQSEFVWSAEVGWCYLHIDQNEMGWRYLNAGQVLAPRDVAAAIVAVLVGRDGWSPSHNDRPPAQTRPALLVALEQASTHRHEGREGATA